MGESKRHHVVPQFYLRAFTDADGKLHRFRKDHGYSRVVTPKQVSFVENFHRYSPERGATLEPVLDQNVEHPLSQHHRAILAGLRISGELPLEEREWLDRMLVHQLLRLPHQRERIERIVEAMTKDPAFAEHELDKVAVARQHHLRIISGLDTTVVRGISQTLGAMEVSFLRTRLDLPFWTADIPVVIGQAHQYGMKLRTALGLPLNHPKTQVYYPLAKDLVGVFHHGTLPLPALRIAEAEPEHVLWINGRLLVNAHRDVYSSRSITVSHKERKAIASPGRRVDLDDYP